MQSTDGQKFIGGVIGFDDFERFVAQDLRELVDYVKEPEERRLRILEHFSHNLLGTGEQDIDTLTGSAYQPPAIEIPRIVPISRISEEDLVDRGDKIARAKKRHKYDKTTGMLTQEFNHVLLSFDKFFTSQDRFIGYDGGLDGRSLEAERLLRELLHRAGIEPYTLKRAESKDKEYFALAGNGYGLIMTPHHSQDVPSGTIVYLSCEKGEARRINRIIANYESLLRVESHS